jgi:hypothetical protein
MIKFFLLVIKKRNVYKIKINACMRREIYLVASINDSFLWHRRLGHISVAPDIAAALKIILNYGKKNRFLASCSFRGKMLFKESPPSIMVTRNPNWST